MPSPADAGACVYTSMEGGHGCQVPLMQGCVYTSVCEGRVHGSQVPLKQECVYTSVEGLVDVRCCRTQHNSVQKCPE